MIISYGLVLLIATGLGTLGGLASGKHFKSIGSNLDDTGRQVSKQFLLCLIDKEMEQVIKK